MTPEQVTGDDERARGLEDDSLADERARVAAEVAEYGDLLADLGDDFGRWYA